MRELYPPCEVVGRYVLPIFRSMIAKELIENYDFTQVEAAEKLGTTQAAISQYIHSKRGFKSIAKFEGILPTIQSAVEEIARGIATGKMNADEVVLSFCRICSSLQPEVKSSEPSAYHGSKKDT